MLFTVIDATAAALLARSLLEKICLISMGLTWLKVNKSKYVQPNFKTTFLHINQHLLGNENKQCKHCIKSGVTDLFLIYWP